MRIIQEVTYRGVAAYLRVVGRTRHGAERHARKVGSALLQDLPTETVRPGRYKGVQEGFHTFEVPVLLNHRNVRKTLAKLMLRGEP